MFMFALQSSSSMAVKVQFIKDGDIQTYRGRQIESGYRFDGGSKSLVTMATLDWPPYIGEQICGKGWVFQFAAALLLAQDHKVTIEFYPWARAVREVELGRMDILMPEYYIEPSAPSDVVDKAKRRDFLALSSPFLGGSLNFLVRRDSQLTYSGTLMGLVGKKIGVVRGYQNTPEFDAMMDAGEFNIAYAVNDFQLAKMLFAKRVDYILADPTVINHSVTQSQLPASEKSELLWQLQPLKPDLAYNPLYFAVSKKRKGWQSLLQGINQEIKRFEQEGEIERLRAVYQACEGVSLEDG